MITWIGVLGTGSWTRIVLVQGPRMVRPFLQQVRKKAAFMNRCLHYAKHEILHGKVFNLR